MEILIPSLRRTEQVCTYLLTYSAPITRKMLHFNDLTFYAIPTLPDEWKAPKWLTIELGIFAGRLYFEFEEYAGLRKYLGFVDTDEGIIAKLGDLTVDRRNDTASPISSVDGIDEFATDEDGKKVADNIRRSHGQSFTAKPLTFLQEWLAIRRKGQDFVHTPMGHVCQGKALKASHPFFTTRVKAEQDGNDIEKAKMSHGVSNKLGGKELGGLDDGYESECSVDDEVGFGVEDGFDDGDGHDGKEGTDVDREADM